ncbi:MAG: FAD-dependent oxidoreductase, partial [Patescibacteria group bacterium]
EYLARAVIIATGARSRTLGLPREKEFWGKGLHTCATCDGFFYRGKTVAVAGGGDSAMEESGFLTRFANKIYIIHRRDEFKASEIMKKRVLANKKITAVWNSEAVEYLGQKKLTGLKIKNITTGEISTLTVDGLFFAIGHIPNTEIFKDYLEREPKFGYLVVKESVYTNVAGVFAAGDCADFTYRQAVTAAGLGAMAAIAAERWLEKN